MTQHIRHVEDESGEDDQEDHDREAVLHRIIGVERNRVLLEAFRILAGLDPSRVVVARHVQRPDVKDDDTGDHEWQQIVQREEALERLVADGRAAHEPGLDAVANNRNGTDEASDHVCAVIGHLPPWQHITKEGRTHHEKEDDHTENPENLARGLVGAVIEAAEHVDVDREEEHRCAIGVDVADQPAIRHIAHDPLD